MPQASSLKPQVSITGWAWNTPLGTSLDEVTCRLLDGQRAFTPRHRFPLDTYPCTLVAPISQKPKTKRHRRYLRRLGLLAMETALEAFELACQRRPQPAGDRIGVMTALGGLRADWDELMPALEMQSDDAKNSWDKGFRQLHPFWMLRYLSNNVHALLAMQLGARGEGLCFGGANAGAQAIVAAQRAIGVGAIDVALVVAYDSLIEPETLMELGTRGELAQVSLESLQAAYSPGANGFVPGEAAAALVLEKPSNATNRTLAYLRAAHATDGRPGEPAVDTIERTTRAVAHHDAIVDGAARANPDLDMAERLALARVVGPAADLIATAASLGRTGAAASLLQTIALGQLLARAQLPPVAGFEHAPADAPLHPVTQRTSTKHRSAIGISTGAPGAVGVVRVEVP